MTLRELAEKYEISRRAARELAKRLPGAKKVATGDSRFESWSIPEEGLEAIDEDVLEEAKEAARAPAAPAPNGAKAPAPPELREEELDVARERLAADRIKAQTARLEAESQRRKAERALEERAPALDPVLADRLARVERALETLATRPALDIAGLLTAAAPLVAPLLTKLTTPAPAPAPASSPFGPSELFDLIGKVRALIPEPARAAESSFRGEIRQAYRDGLADGVERAGAGGGEESTVDKIIAGVSTVAQHLGPSLADLARAYAAKLGAPPAPVSAPEQPHALPEAPAPAPAAAPAPPNPLQEILDALVAELRQPERDLAGITAFLDSIMLDAETTLLDRISPIAHATPSLARASLKLYDARLVDEETWPGTEALLAALRTDHSREPQET